jgi:hypothetical protein
VCRYRLRVSWLIVTTARIIFPYPTQISEVQWTPPYPSMNFIRKLGTPTHSLGPVNKVSSSLSPYCTYKIKCLHSLIFILQIYRCINVKFLGGKGGRYVELTTLPPSSDDCLEIREPQPPGTLGVCLGLYMDSFYSLSLILQDFLGILCNKNTKTNRTVEISKRDQATP